MGTREKDVRYWSDVLGLLPVPILPGDKGERYVLLNGTSGNFCLDLEAVASRDGKRDVAWSSDVGHYVSLIQETVEVLPYDNSKTAAETFSLSSVLSNLGEFHQYLERIQPRPETSVVAHVIRVFRQLRSAMPEDNGRNSLLAFLTLFACATEDVHLEALDLKVWGLSEESPLAASEISLQDWVSLLRDLMEGGSLYNLVLKPNLLLRHAAGQVFQEAHYEASRVSQLQLPGFSPGPATVSKVARGVGIHFTPPALARTLVEQTLRTTTLDSKGIRVFDPACGSAEFLREALRQIRLGGYHGPVHLIGWDVSPAACDMASFLLAWEKRSDSYPVKVDIRVVDSLSVDQWPHADILIMNPPFVSYEGLSDDQRAAITGVLGGLAKGRFDLSTSFVWKAFTSQPKGTSVATVIPASFLEAEAALPVRTALAELMGLRLVARLGSQLLFSNATVDAAALIGRVGDMSERDVLAFWADHRISSTSAGLRQLRRSSQQGTRAAVVGDGFSIYRVPNLESNFRSWSPRSYRAWNFLTRVQNLPTVKELFHVRTGSRPGHLPAFLVSKTRWADLPARERKYFRPAVVNSSISFGQLRDATYVFYPYGRRAIENERALRLTVPTFYKDVLQPNKAALQKRTSKRDPERWWEMSESRSWQHLPEAKLVSVYFGDAGSFAYDESGEFVVVQGFAWLPKASVKVHQLFSPKLALAYLAVLNSHVISELLSATSNPVKGGQWDLSARYVEKMPLPNLAAAVDTPLLSALSELGASLHRGEPVSVEDITDAAYAAYGLNQ